MKTIVVKRIAPRVFLFIACLLAAEARRAQAQATPPAPQPGQPSPQTPAPSPGAAPTTTTKPAAVESPYDTGDGQFAVKLLYWYNPANLQMKTGQDAGLNVVSAVTFEGKNKPTPGAEISLPAGKLNSIRISYFRMQKGGNTRAPNIPASDQLVIWSAGFNPGDYLATSYTLQNAKISLDYLSWPFPVKDSRFRFKTLWEVQYTTIKSSVDAPFAPTTDASGNALTTSGSGSRWFIWPSLGAGIEYAVSKHFRFEAKGSGFALPHRSQLWDAEAFFAYRAGAIEIDFGGKAFHFRTSPKRAEYFEATLPGAYIGIRWYPK